MTRTDLDARTLARSLRCMAGDGSVEWVMEPIQADVLRDIADMLAENAELRETLKRRNRQFETMTDMWAARGAENAKLRELLSEIAKLVTNPYGGCLRPGCAHGCPHHLECDEELHTCFYVDRMRELGVEVDNG